MLLPMASILSARGRRIAPSGGGGGGGLPSWVSALSLWQWYAIPNTNLSGIVPSPQPPGSPSAKVDAWNGGALRRSGSWYVLGACGGHNDYAGNEVNAIQLNSETPTWTQKTTPTISSLCYNAGTQFYGDYQPAATHTYYATVYSDATDQMIVMPSPGLGLTIGVSPPGGWPYPNDSSYLPFVYNWNAGWKDPRDGDYPAGYPGSGDWTACMVAKNPSTGLIYYRRSGGSSLYTFNPSTGAWATVGSNWSQDYCGAAVDPTRGRMLVAGNYDQNIQPKIRSLSTGADLGLSFTGDTSPFVTISPTILYDEANDTYLLIRNSGGSIIVRRVTAGGLVIDTPSMTGTPPAARTNGVYGAAQYVPELKGFMIHASYSGSVYFVRTAL